MSKKPLKAETCSATFGTSSFLKCLLFLLPVDVLTNLVVAISVVVVAVVGVSCISTCSSFAIIATPVLLLLLLLLYAVHFGHKCKSHQPFVALGYQPTNTLAYACMCPRSCVCVRVLLILALVKRSLCSARLYICMHVCM